MLKSVNLPKLAREEKGKYGLLPAKIAETLPWRSFCVNLIGPYTIKAKYKTILDFMCLTAIDPTTCRFEIIVLPLTSVTVNREDKEITRQFHAHIPNKTLLALRTFTYLYVPTKN